MTDLSEDFVYGMKERRTDLIERSIHVTDGGPNYQSPLCLQSCPIIILLQRPYLEHQGNVVSRLVIGGAGVIIRVRGWGLGFKT